LDYFLGAQSGGVVTYEPTSTGQAFSKSQVPIMRGKRSRVVNSKQTTLSQGFCLSLKMATIMITSSLHFAAAVASRGEVATRKGAVGGLLFKSPAFLALSVRGGSSSTAHDSSSSSSSSSNYITLANPAPGSPFHYAFPVHSLEAAKEFYGTILACDEGRSSSKWQDYSLHGHQIVCHYVGDDYRCVDYYNLVGGDEVPVPHAGLALTVDQFHALAHRLRTFNVQFIIEPHLRFVNMPGEQWTMFFKDPSGNNLEFNAMTKMENLFASIMLIDHVCVCVEKE
jgi:extradiol dioxygenase family protein